MRMEVVMIKTVQIDRGDTVEVKADVRLIVISVLNDGTVNINTPDGAICKIHPSYEVPKKEGE